MSGSCPGWRRATSRARILAAAIASGSARQSRGFPLNKNSSLKPINCKQGGSPAKRCGRNQRRSFRIRARQFPRCSVSGIIGGQLSEIRAECHCYHGHFTGKREQEPAPQVCRFEVISLMLQRPVSLFKFPISTVAHKLETDSGIRIGLSAVKATVCFDPCGVGHHVVGHGVVVLDASLLGSRGLGGRGRCEDRGQGQCGNQGLNKNAPRKISRRSGKHVRSWPPRRLYAPFMLCRVKYFTQARCVPHLFAERCVWRLLWSEKVIARCDESANI